MMCCHFKATHEPWDFPERLAHIYDGVTFPRTGKHDGVRARKSPGVPSPDSRWRTWHAGGASRRKTDSWWCKYPELPFSIEGMSKEDARRKIYQKLIRDYLRCGAAIDDNIGRLLRFLDEEGLAENTIVVYVSDQGYFLGEHGMFDKRWSLEEPLRMPFVSATRMRSPPERAIATSSSTRILLPCWPTMPE